ncbi:MULTISPECIES: hypothetical protein [Actinomycetes]|uniref:hypothetical protein n=1 Tax=Actinomycetes TaxID=1760 RepID=UPI0018F8AB8C|nr:MULTISPECIES: hypothetical protein [Actinomycetes]
MASDEPLPAAAGSTPAGTGEAPAPRRRSRRAAGPVRIASGDPVRAQPRDSQDPAAVSGRAVARAAGVCDACGKPYPPGARLGRIGEGRGHEACAAIAAETEKIRSGATFRSRRASSWRRGAGPGKTRDRF